MTGTIITQILWGSLVLGVCTMLNLSIIIGWVGVLRKFPAGNVGRARMLRQTIIIGSALLMIIVAHTLQVWIWAIFLMVLGALPTLSDAVYYTLVTYTTVGYGDLTLGSDFRIFGAMASVTGLLGFGISTAFLVGLLGKLFPRHLG